MIQEKDIRTNTKQLTIRSTQIGKDFNPIELFRNAQEWQYWNIEILTKHSPI